MSQVETRKKELSPTILRVVQLCHVMLIILSPIPAILVTLVRATNPPENFNLATANIEVLSIEFFVFMASVVLAIKVHRKKYGPREDDWMLFLIIAMSFILAIVLAGQMMYMALPIAVFAIGVYNIAIAERKIRDIKLTSEGRDES